MKKIAAVIKVKKFVFNPFQENSYVVHDGKVCVIIDPGCSNQDEQQLLVDFIADQGLTPVALLLTHAHIDHVLGCHFVLNTYDIPFYMHEEDLQTLHAVSSYAHVYGFENYTPPRDPENLLKGGELLRFGELAFDVLFTPGHCTGHVVYFARENGFVINGDVLFAGSFGRTDLPGGNLEVLKASIFGQLFSLPEDTIVYCGHGPETTIGEEKRSNYILQF